MHSSLDGGRSPSETILTEEELSGDTETGFPPGWDEEVIEDAYATLDEVWRNQEVRVGGRWNLAGWWAEEKRKAIEECGRKATLVVRGCGAKVAVPHRCHSLLCSRCARIDLWSRVRQYLPDIQGRLNEGEVQARFFTLTVPGERSEALRWRIRRIKAAWRRFMDIRLGPRAMKRWERLFLEVLERSNLDEEQRRRQIGLFEEFRARVEAHRERLGRSSVRLCEITGGLARLEVKYEGFSWWHPHVHVLLLSNFPIPQALLSIWWTWAFREKAFSVEDLLVTDIRAVTFSHSKVVAYIAKYIVKSEGVEALTGMDKEAFLFALLYCRKIWAWGLTRREPERRRCPVCGSPDCGVEEVVYARVSVEKSLFELRRGEIAEWTLEVETDQDGHIEILAVGWIVKRGRYWLWGTDQDPIPPPEEPLEDELEEPPWEELEGVEELEEIDREFRH